jgi:hypothetical protein
VLKNNRTRSANSDSKLNPRSKGNIKSLLQQAGASSHGNNKSARKKIVEALEQSELYRKPRNAKSWLDPKCKASFPKFSRQLLQVISEHTLKNYNIATLETVQGALNAAYSGAGIGDGKGPWKNCPMATTEARKYKKARATLVKQTGQKNAYKKVDLHEDAVKHILKVGEAAETGSMLKSECALLMVGVLFCLRSCSLYFEEGDVTINPLGTLTVMSKRNKKDGEIVRQVKRAPPAWARGHPRARVMRLVSQALEGHGLCIVPRGTETRTSEFVTKILRDVVPEEVLNLAPGTQVTSHSLRKTAASAISAAGVDTERALMPWGDWTCHSSLTKYINRSYLVTEWSRRLWDWLGTAGDVSLNLVSLPNYAGPPEALRVPVHELTFHGYSLDFWASLAPGADGPPGAGAALMQLEDA